MISSIKLHNFKCYQDQKFELSNLTVFCGNNSVGKSTAIQALAILLQSKFSFFASLNGELTDVGNCDDIQCYNNQGDDSLFIEVKSSYGNAKWGYDSYEKRSEVPTRLLFVGDDEEQENLDKLGLFCSRFQYLQAERYGPRDNFRLSQERFHSDWLGAKGEYTPEVLEKLINKKRKHLSNSPLRIRDAIVGSDDPRKHPSQETHEMFRNIQAWMGEISPGFSMSPKTLEEANVSYNTFLPKGGRPTKPINVGFGLSYALSIVTALITAPNNGLVIIENPEAHLHPKGQSYLGRLIALTAQAGVQVIVETHSDHVINGMRIMPRLGLVDSSNITIYQVYGGTDGSEVHKISVDEQGQLSEWPKDFFDQQLMDMDILLTGRDE